MIELRVVYCPKKNKPLYWRLRSLKIPRCWSLNRSVFTYIALLVVRPFRLWKISTMKGVLKLQFILDLRDGIPGGKWKGVYSYDTRATNQLLFRYTSWLGIKLLSSSQDCISRILHSLGTSSNWINSEFCHWKALIHQVCKIRSPVD